MTAEELEALVYLVRNTELKGDSGKLFASDHVVVPNVARAERQLNRFGPGEEYSHRRAHLSWSRQVLGVYMALGLEHASVTQSFMVKKVREVVGVPEDDIRVALGFDTEPDLIKRLFVLNELCKHLSKAGKIVPTQEPNPEASRTAFFPFLQEGMFNSTHDILGNPLPVFFASEQNGAGGVAQKNLSVLRDLNDREFSELFTRVMQRNITGEEAKLYGHFSTADFCNVASDRLNRES
jgi:hypothetical protein